MTAKKNKPPSGREFFAAAEKYAEKFSWPTKSLDRSPEFILVAGTKSDPYFDRFVWVYNINRMMLRCILVSRKKVSSKNQQAVFEFCTRVNDNLPFGCLEYSFHDEVLVFRDTTEIGWAPLDESIKAVMTRILNLGKRYGKAIDEVLDGKAPETAIKDAEAK